MFDAFLNLVDRALRPHSGRVLYSGRAAFSRASSLYILGLNPGGNPILQVNETIARDVEEARARPDDWSAYRDDRWNGYPAGTRGMQPRVLHLFNRLNLSPGTVPASNVVFVRTRRESDLKASKQELLEACWPVHGAVIDGLGIRTVLCFGNTAGAWVREIMGADREVDRFVEENNRRWKSCVHRSRDGMSVITLTHPSIADWTKPATDPSPMVLREIQQQASFVSPSSREHFTSF